ncbi:hypothetical protein GQ53DRAFT_855213 [Thozetella sp. PMI_491]|nr:hypothetical protein GQ53DRAFT_855213 [Thozetella sp. PMI_491]
MPEPFATFTAVLGIVNLLRSALRSLHDDTIEWRNYPGWSQNNRNLFREHEESFLEWQRRWMVWVKDDNILELFWGPAWDKIIEELERIKDVFKTLAKSLERTNPESRGLLRRHFSRFWNSFVIQRTDQITKALGKLEGQIASLNKESNRAFFRHPTLNRLERWEPIPEGQPGNARIHQLGLSVLLIRLAWDTSDVSNQLHRCALRDYETLEMELELNHFGRDLKDVDRCTSENADIALPFVTPNFTGRPEAVARSSADSSLHYTFIVKELERGRDQLWLRIRATPDPEVEEFYLSFHEAIRRIRDNLNSPCGLTLSNNEATAWLRAELGYIRRDIATPTPLRQVLMTTPTRDAPEFNIVKAHRALQIAEFGLLFFKTTWIKSLCSCTVREMQVTSNNERDRDEALYRLTLRRLAQNARDVPADPVPGCWCRYKTAAGEDGGALIALMEQFPLFSIGLLLIEVALSRPITNIEIEGQVAHESKIQLRYYGWIPPNGQPPQAAGVEQPLPKIEDLKDELNMGSGPASPLYPAIKFCIERRFTAETINREDLKSYFWGVIDPIFKTYNHHVHLRRQQQ